MTSVPERYARAVHSSNLRGSDVRLVDVDVLTAAGWAGQQAPLAAVLHRAMASPSSTAATRSARGVMRTHALRRANATRYPYAAATRAADAVLTWLLHPQCPRCHGVRFEPVPTAARLSAVACPACCGTGKAHAPYAGDPFAEALHAGVELKMEVFERHVARRIRYS